MVVVIILSNNRLFIIIILTERAARIVEIMLLAALGTASLRQSVRCFFCGKEFDFAAAGAVVDIDLHRACEKVRKIPENPSGLTEL